jgi:hypothetical protein
MGGGGGSADTGLRLSSTTSKCSGLAVNALSKMLLFFVSEIEFVAEDVEAAEDVEEDE